MLAVSLMTFHLVLPQNLTRKPFNNRVLKNWNVIKSNIHLYFIIYTFITARIVLSTFWEKESLYGSNERVNLSHKIVTEHAAPRPNPKATGLLKCKHFLRTLDFCSRCGFLRSSNMCRELPALKRLPCVVFLSSNSPIHVVTTKL